MQDFQQKYSRNYSSTFSSEPASRPSYIPQTTVVGGNTYHIYYDYSHGGYGYWNGSAWNTYNVLSDALMLDALMHQHNYYYDGYGSPMSYGNPGPGYYGNPGPGYYPVRTYHSGGILSGLICVLLLIIVAVVIARMARF